MSGRPLSSECRLRYLTTGLDTVPSLTLCRPRTPLSFDGLSPSTERRVRWSDDPGLGIRRTKGFGRHENVHTPREMKDRRLQRQRMYGIVTRNELKGGT